MTPGGGTIPPMYQEKGLYRKYAKLMKETVNVPHPHGRPHG